MVDRQSPLVGMLSHVDVLRISAKRRI